MFEHRKELSFKIILSHSVVTSTDFRCPLKLLSKIYTGLFLRGKTDLGVKLTNYFVFNVGDKIV
jgi:hypothetical protein